MNDADLAAALGQDLEEPVDARGVVIDAALLREIVDSVRLRSGGARFDHATFADEFRLPGFRADRAMRFDGASFRARADFGGAAFAGQASFTASVFQGAVTFAGARFEGEVDFSSAVFEGYAGFGGVSFAAPARFTGASFGRVAWFGDARFEGDERGGAAAGFAKVRFGSLAGFGRARFHGDAVFSQARFDGEAAFANCEFASSADFSRAAFGGRVNFDQVMIAGKARFGTVQMRSAASFQHAELSSGVDFRAAACHADIEFDATSFEGEVDFSSAVFEGYAGFGGVSFAAPARFTGASFGRVAWFGDARFEGDERGGAAAGFAKVRFGSLAGFGRARFHGDAVFSQARFDGEAAFANCEFGSSTDFSRAAFGASADFSGTRFGGDADLVAAAFAADASFVDARIHRRFALAGASVGGSLRADRADFISTGDLGPLQVEGTLVLDSARFGSHLTLDVTAARVSCCATRYQAGASLSVSAAEVSLEDARFGAESILRGRRPVPAQRPVRLVSLRRAEVGNLAVEGLDLSSCLFAGAHSLRALSVEGVPQFATTPRALQRRLKVPWRWTSRATVAEEHHWRHEQASVGEGWYPPHCQVGWLGEAGAIPAVTPLEAQEVAAIYSALRQSRVGSGDVQGANEFLYGAMELKRHSQTLSRLERLFLWQSWIAWGYGLRPSRPILMLAATITGGGTFQWAVGMRPRPRLQHALVTSAKASIGLARPRESATNSLTASGRAVDTALRTAGRVLALLAVNATRARGRR